MATPRYDALIDKVRDWSNKPEAATIPNSVIQDCLGYAADDCYRNLRIPPLEYTVQYTVSADDNAGDTNTNVPNSKYTSFVMPSDLSEFIYLRIISQANEVSTVFNEITDKRTFFDTWSEKYNTYNWMWQDDKIYIRPQLPVDTVLEIHYYRRLPSLDALYTVVPINYLIGVPDANQPYLTLGTASDTPLYFSTSASVERCFATYAEAAAYNPTVTTKYYVGNEVSHWLKDQQEKLLCWGALQYLGAYLFDDKMEMRYLNRFMETIKQFNTEEKMRRAKGGNVQMNFNSNGLI